MEATELVYAWPGQAPCLAIPRFTVSPGERLFVAGPSGSGKSTLLGLIGGVLTATSGRLRVLGEELRALSAARRDALRARDVGFIFQMFNLVPYLSLVDNVLLPCRFSPARRAQAGSDLEAEARRLLARLGLDDPAMLERPVTALSIGQQQRVAAARALVGAPALVIADEPTSALDADARARFVELLLEECAAAASTVLFVSHDRSLAPHFTRAVELADLNRSGTGSRV